MSLARGDLVVGSPFREQVEPKLPDMFGSVMAFRDDGDLTNGTVAVEWEISSGRRVTTWHHENEVTKVDL